jgi:hypothetical protein
VSRDPEGTTEEERLKLFDGLVSEVRAVHQFSPNTWENLAPLSFSRALPELRDAFAGAVTEAQLLGALARFGRSLHDVHCGFVPDPPFRAHLTLPLVITPSWRGGEMTMVVTESRERGIAAGDVVTSYAGTPAAALLRVYADRSNANQWRGIALGVADWMTERPADGGDGVDGGTVTVGVRTHDGAEAFANLTWSRGGWHGEDKDAPAAPVYTGPRCAPGLPARKYPGYDLASVGDTYCLYTSKTSKYAPFPLLRFFSFDFGSAWEAEVTYGQLARALAGQAGPGERRARGLIVDLRDNRGGNDPNWVLDWLAPKPYLDLRTQVRKTPRVDALVLEDVASLDEGWVDALAHAPEGAVVSRFLGCTTADCSDTKRQPQHRLLAVPTVLLVGPRCNGACDHFARVWEENGLGPLVGEPSGASLSVLRLDVPVMVGARRVGVMRLAISVDTSPFTNEPVEGLPLHIDTPVEWTWETRDVYDAQMVDAAIAAMGK